METNARAPAETTSEAPDASGTASGAALAELASLVRATWGYPSLKPFQAEAMLAALAGRDALVVLATGAGKSLCYQAPALLREGLTVVVSPLISLMKDQIDGLEGNGVPAAMLSSAQDPGEKRRVFERLAARELKLLYVAPERLLLPGFFDELESFGLSSLVIDEAHCISHWGHDFRPEYRELGLLRLTRPHLPVQAYTATATPEVRADVAQQLHLVDPLLLVGGFDRPNLAYRFLPRRELLAQVLGVIRRHPEQAGIVYCLRRKDVDALAPDLARAGISCAPYHAGLDADVRRENQERFLADRVQVIVATVAFGMGIDRPDVRFVVHAALPKGIEQFSQETGRAGRDGLPAECVLFYSASDFHGWKSLMERSAEEARESGVERAGEDLEGSLARLSRMLSFATGARCRHRFLVEHFGQAWPSASDSPEASGAGCGACDVCLGELPAIDDALVVAQKILSCVVRCGQRFGAGHIADVLCGGTTDKIRQCGHEQLSTYGLLRQHSVREVRHWIEQLVGRGDLRVASGQYPTLSLSRSGLEVLRAEREVTLFAMPKPAKASRTRASLASLAADAAAPPPDEALFGELRALRRRLALERGVPPYLIFNDRTLALMASRKPTTPAALREIKGVGDKKAQDLGPAFLEAIGAFVRA